MSYSRRVKRRIKNKKIFIIIFVILIIFIVKIIPMLVLKNFINNDDNINVDVSKYKQIRTQDFTIATFLDYLQVVNEEENIEIRFDDSENVTTNEIYKFNINISNADTEKMYEIEYGIGENVKKEYLQDKEYECTLKEGKNDFYVKIYKNQEIIGNYKNIVYYIQPYQKQFLDEFSNKSIQVHYIDGTWEKYEKSIQMVKYSGFRNIKSSFLWNSIEKDNDFNFEYYDKWMNEANELGIKVYACINRTGKYGGDNKIIDNEEELEHFVNFFDVLTKRYSNIIGYDILNEPNVVSSNNGGYITENEVQWYSKIIKRFKEINPNVNIVPAALSNYASSNDSRLAMNEFFEYMVDNGVYNIANEFSYHVYDYTNQANQDIILSKTLKEEEELFNNFGGFIKTNITEYGLSSNSVNKVTEDIQARKLVQQTVLMDQFNINFANLYNFWNTGNDIDEHEYNFGIVNHDYTPKLAYYSMKKFLTNTNGAEYIGTVNLADGLEAHVYDKDGKPKIIAWADNSDNAINIDYTGFTVKDLYGNDIENTDGKLEITTSPVYLDNISTKYFYEAISNTALEKYTEFEEKFGTEISSVDGLQERIDSLKQYMGSIYDVSSESEEIAKEKMKEHFDLGNLILEAYKNGSLDVEYVKLSSMLDMLNDIGDSYEDLVTVSSVTRNPDLQGTKTLIDNTEQEINNNSDIEIVYPTKILEFSKDLYEKADYINNLEEENDIKTGLIVSYDLHAKYLADWANTFANIYIDDYIENNPITESYSETNLTNKDVTVTLNIGEDTKITNNDGSNIYTFKDNGTFKFEYDRRGRTFSKEVKVENIDKTSPVISDVQNGTTYSNSVTPLIGDEHLKDVQLKLNGQVVKEYLLGSEIKEEGKYELVAKDWAGNETKVEFEIKYELEPESEEYTFDGQYIIGVNQNTALEKFIEILNGNVEYDVYRDDKLLENGEIVATGDRVVTKNGETYYIIVKGDVTKDGKTNIKDIVQMRRNILKLEEFDEYQKVAADLAKDNVINIKDLVIIRRIILGLEI